ncbi:MAG TPA: hypothetical protein VK928_13155 [Longimicrobiales bacterium]|nr:hypothetical protein [Longimicrobiales bacterium]
MVEPQADTQPRIVALGGRGQDPGAGRNGVRGASRSSWSSVPFELNDSNISRSKATVAFDPPAVYIAYDWRWGAVSVGTGKKGDDSFPENGTDAVRAGAPGDAGDGGAFTTNVAGLVARVRNEGGAAGTKERDCWGGPAGTPTLSAKYTVKLWHNIFGTNNADYERNETKRNSTKAGADAPAPAAPRARGTTPQPVVKPIANAWLHPLSLQRCLEYAREAFLAGARDDVQSMMSAYDVALAADMPANGAWADGTEAQWSAAQVEVAAMLQRLRAHLDYFGNGAGYRPLLSLRGTAQLYEQETGRALRTLLLARWIDGRERDAKSAQAALAEAINMMNAESQQAAVQVTTAEARISSATSRIEALEQELNGLAHELEKLRNTLLTKAENDLQQQAQIKFAIRMAAAVCQVIPVGQPALGAIGSLAGTASELIGDDGSGVPDTVSKMGDVLKKANEAATKAEAARKKAEKEKAKEPEKDAASAKAGAAAWAQVGKGLGPAMSQVSAGIKALQVPASEVEAQLQKLEADSKEWGELTDRIRDLNVRKTSLFDDLTQGFEALGEGYARIAGNAAATFTMQQERNRQVGRLDPAATAFVRQMSQRSRLTLLKYLYLMVRSYETTVFRTITVDWNLTSITDKILELVQPDAGFTAGSIEQYAKALTPLFQENLAKVRTQLLADFEINDRTMTLQLGLSADQTPEQVALVNDGGVLRIDPLEYGLVLADRHLARLSGVKLKSLEIDPHGPALPETGNMVITLRPALTGTMRRAEQLYGVYSEQKMEWGWTRLASGEVRASVPSQATEDMLNLVLGTGAERIRQKVSLPPLWSDLTIAVRFSPELPPERRPRVTRLYFEFECDASPAPEHQCVLTVQPAGTPGGAVIDCSPDLARRASGFDSMVRIFSRGAQVRIAATQPRSAATFDAWSLVGRHVNMPRVTDPAVSVTLSDHVLARSTWNRASAALESAVVMPQVDTAAIQRMLEQHPEARPKMKLRRAAAPPPVSDLPMRIAAADAATVIGMAPSLGDVEVVEIGTDGWMLVNYRGTVGWVSTLTAVRTDVDAHADSAPSPEPPLEADPSA